MHPNFGPLHLSGKKKVKMIVLCNLLVLESFCCLLGRYFYKVYIVKMFEIMFSFNVKDNNIFPCLYNIRLSYKIQKCFSVLSIRMRMSK